MNASRILQAAQHDVRHGLRMLRNNPGFSAAAILALALGIGANTAIFSLVSAVLIRPLPYQRSESLVGVFNSAVIQGEVINDFALAPGMYTALTQGSAAFEQFGVWSAGTAAVTGGGEPEQIHTLTMTREVLLTLGTEPVLGRGFSAGDDTKGAPATVILSHGYWQRRFGGETKIIGRTILIDSIPYQVIGVMPRDFRFLNLAPDALLPQRFAKGDLAVDPWAFNGIARLKPGVSIEIANRDTARVLESWSTFSLPEEIRRAYEQFHIRPNRRPLKRDVVGDAGTVLRVLMGALALMLMLVCANVANLVLVRARSRHREFAIRAALGAGPGRIAGALLVESLMLGLLGGACGMVLAYGAVEILKIQGSSTIPRLTEVSINGETLLFGLACSVCSSLLSGAIAAWKCGIPAGIVSLRGASAGVGQLRAQNLLAVSQIALAVVLSVASGLLIRSFLAMRAVPPGFTGPEHIQTVRLSITETQTPEPERVARMQLDIVSAVSQLPGVTAAGLADGMPMDAENRDTTLIAVEGKIAAGQPPSPRDTKYISPGLFAAQGTRLLAGRDFSWQDVSQHRLAAIVSENIARESWGDPKAALGKRLRPGAIGDNWFEVVGVVENVHDEGAQKPAPPMIYFRCGVYAAWPARTRRNLTLAIRSSRAGTASFLREVATAVHSVNPNLPLAEVRTLDDVYRRSMARTSFTLVLLGVAAAMSLLLAIIGVYGVVAYAAGQRRREVSIRMALGARSGQIKTLFLRRAIVLACAGGIIGLVTAAGLSRWVSSIVFGVIVLDPLTYSCSAVVIVAAAVLAGYIPALRAASVEPIECLRAD